MRKSRTGIATRSPARFVPVVVGALLVCCLSQAEAATYFVDPSSGNNSNAGTSTGAAWRNPPGTRTTSNGGFISTSWGAITSSNKLACGDTVLLRPGATQTSSQGGAWLIDATYYSNCTAGSPITIKVANSSQWSGASGHFTLNGSGISATWSQSRGFDSHRALISVADRAYIRVMGEDATRRLVITNAGDWSVNVHCAGCTQSGFRGAWWELRNGEAGFNIGGYNDWHVSNSIAHDLGASGFGTGLNNDITVDRGAFVDVETYRTGSATAQTGNDDGFFFTGGAGLWCVRCNSHNNNQRGFNTGVIQNGAGVPFNFRFRDLLAYDNGAVCGPVNCIGAGFEVSGNDFATSANANNVITGAVFYHNPDGGAGNYLAATLEIWNATFYRTHHERPEMGSLVYDTTAKQLSLFNSVDLARPGFQAFSMANNSNGGAPQPRLQPITGNNCLAPPSSNSDSLGVPGIADGTYANPPAFIGSTNRVGSSNCVPNFVALHDSSYASCDFRPNQGSMLIDGGRFLMRANSAGTNATTINVRANGGSSDPRNFFIAASSYWDPVSADTQVQIEGCGVRTITSMTATSITFSPACSWANNAGVHLPWAGAAPDIGAKEFGQAGGGGGGGAPAPPTLLSVEPL